MHLHLLSKKKVIDLVKKAIWSNIVNMWKWIDVEDKRATDKHTYLVVEHCTAVYYSFIQQKHVQKSNGCPYSSDNRSYMCCNLLLSYPRWCGGKKFNNG